MKSRTITILGGIVAALSFVSPNLPADTPDWARLLIGALLAAATSIGGYTHPGTKKP